MQGVIVATVIMTIVMIAIMVIIINTAYKRKWGNEETTPEPKTNEKSQSVANIHQKSGETAENA